MNPNNNDADNGASLSNLELDTCPYCGSAAARYPQNNGQARAIYCVNCPLGVEDNELDFVALAMVWNNLPRATQTDEPVAWMVVNDGGQDCFVTADPNIAEHGQRALPLYTGVRSIDAG